jgi:Family of unknown function (DUF6616)
MECYIELWKEKDVWKNLPKKEKEEYLNQIGPHMEKLLGKGVQIVGWGTNKPSTVSRIDYDFFAVWKFPDGALMEEFETAVATAGWYNYFEQHNVSGELVYPEDVIRKLIY